jgi:hypothetical protein
VGESRWCQNTCAAFQHSCTLQGQTEQICIHKAQHSKLPSPALVVVVVVVFVVVVVVVVVVVFCFNYT